MTRGRYEPRDLVEPRTVGDMTFGYDETARRLVPGYPTQMLLDGVWRERDGVREYRAVDCWGGVDWRPLREGGDR